MVKRRIPDATMGLRSYDKSDMANGFACHLQGNDKTRTVMKPNRALSQDRLLSQLFNRECGLMPDGIWGSADILFPFAIYEAKKRGESLEAARGQIRHACRTYLAMLDDLARDPADVTRYQSKRSRRYQLFGFISCGVRWRSILPFSSSALVWVASDPSHDHLG